MRGNLPSPDTPRVGAPSGFGRYGYLDGDDSTIMCHECGQLFSSLGAHLSSQHGLTAREYKVRHGLPLGKGLISPALHRSQSSKAKDRVGTDKWEKLEAKRDPTAASHSRDKIALTRRGVQAEKLAEHARTVIAGQSKPPIDKPCVVCLRQVANASFLTCSDTCRRISQYRELGGGQIAVKIIGMRDEGLTWAEIGGHFGVSGQAAGARVRAFMRHMEDVRQVMEIRPQAVVKPYEKPYL